MPTVRSNSVMNLSRATEILVGCSPRVATMRSAVCGLRRINSTAATIKASWLLTSCRIADNLFLKSASCWAVKVTGWLGKIIANDGLKARERQATFGDFGGAPGGLLPQLRVDNFRLPHMFHGVTNRERGP